MTPELNEDFRDMLLALKRAKVEFVVIGAHALAAHGLPRATGVSFDEAWSTRMPVRVAMLDLPF